ncbi:MAG: hypothetical protein ACOY3I_10365 [Verrucomicrobiota bacterium]
MNREDIMHEGIRIAVIIAMLLLTIVSMWTTYVSVKDSILPAPIATLPWIGSFSILAFFLALGIGLMLMALKLAILDEKKHLNIFGLIGLTIIAFISIAFNMDVLYRTADQQFFLNYCNNKVRGVYEPYLADVQTSLIKRRDEIRRSVATQTTEMDTEIEGLRSGIAGFGPAAKEEAYRLRILEATTSAELQSIEDALAAKRQADDILLSTDVSTVEKVQEMQTLVRNTIKDAGALAGVPLPLPVQWESPLFAVFSKLFDVRMVGLKEIFFFAISIFLDLGDIVGYKLVPNKKRSRKEMARASSGMATGRKFSDKLALPSGPNEHVLMDTVSMNEKFQNYCRTCGFKWIPKKKYFKRNDGTIIREATGGSFGWELVKGDRIVPIWIAVAPINNPHGIDIPAHVWNQAKAGNAILLEPQNGEFVELQCEAIRQDVEAGRLRSTAVYRIKLSPPVS